MSYFYKINISLIINSNSYLHIYNLSSHKYVSSYNFCDRQLNWIDFTEVTVNKDIFWLLMLRKRLEILKLLLVAMSGELLEGLIKMKLKRPICLVSSYKHLNNFESNLLFSIFFSETRYVLRILKCFMCDVTCCLTNLTILIFHNS